jgi:hypothetical protein
MKWTTAETAEKGGKSKNDSREEAATAEKGRTTSESVSFAEDVPDSGRLGGPIPSFYGK